MSNLISVSFEVRNMAIMKDTLKQMGLEATEQNETLTIMRNRYPISINASTGEISFDSDQRREVDQIKQTYMENFYRDRAIREGMKIHKEVKANGAIELYLSN